MYCCSYVFEGSVAAIHKPEYTREKKVSRVLRRLVYYGTYTVGAVGVDAPQFESFYTVPTCYSFRDLEDGEKYASYYFFVLIVNLSKLLKRLYFVDNK